MRDWLLDLRYGVRMIAKRPGTSAIAIVALALGIGLTTTMFSIVQGVILRGLPFAESERIAFISGPPCQRPRTGARSPRMTSSTSAIGRPRLRIAGRLSEQHRPRSPATPRCPSGCAAPASRRMCSTVLRIAPIVGRDFTEADAAPGAPAVALISYRQWQSRFGRAPTPSARPIRLNGAPTTIIGVMPEKFGFPEAEDIWLPHDVALAVKRGDRAAGLERRSAGCATA